MALKFSVDGGYASDTIYSFDIDNIKDNIEEFHRMMADTNSPFIVNLNGFTIKLPDEVGKAIFLRTLNAFIGRI